MSAVFSHLVGNFFGSLTGGFACNFVGSFIVSFQAVLWALS
jgi:hypothetical protein